KPLDSDYGLQAQAALTLKFLRANDVEKCIVVGNSMGGAIAAEMAIQDPQLVSHLVLINSAHDPRIVRRIIWFDVRRTRKLIASSIAPLVNRITVKQFIRTLYGTPRDINDNIINNYLAPYRQSRSAHLA